MEFLEQNYETIRDELREALRDPLLEQKGNAIWVAAARDDAEGYGPDWRTLVLQDRCEWEPNNVALFEKTRAALVRAANTPSVEVFFAKQAPKTGIKPHTDFTNFIMTAHLGSGRPASARELDEGWRGASASGKRRRHVRGHEFHPQHVQRERVDRPVRLDRSVLAPGVDLARAERRAVSVRRVRGLVAGGAGARARAARAREAADAADAADAGGGGRGGGGGGAGPQKPGGRKKNKRNKRKAASRSGDGLGLLAKGMK